MTDNVYDFYNNPPKTKEDIREYLTTWLKKQENHEPLVIDGESFVIEMGFNRAYHGHCVFRSLSTNEYVWWVSQEFKPETFPKKRYASYESLLENVINDYYVEWKLDTRPSS